MKKPPLVDDDDWELAKEKQEDEGTCTCMYNNYYVWCTVYHHQLIPCMYMKYVQSWCFACYISLKRWSGEDELDYDVRVKLSQEESEIRGHLIHREPLSEEIIEKLATQFWEKEPYK